MHSCSMMLIAASVVPMPLNIEACRRVLGEDNMLASICFGVKACNRACMRIVGHRISGLAFRKASLSSGQGAFEIILS